jgi:REP element-mobilizing transposase RayT
MARQLQLALPKRGGRRKGAGRPRTRPHPGLVGAGVPHLARGELAARHPVHVTLRLQPGIGYLRSWRRARVLQEAFGCARERFGVRIVHYSIQGNHLHLIVEARSAEALSRAMQGLGIRIAKRLNALAGRRGGVFADRYHRHVLRSRREVANAVRYVLANYHHHTREHLPPRWEDALSSARFLHRAPAGEAPVVAPRTWLLRVGWRFQPGSAEPG